MSVSITSQVDHSTDTILDVDGSPLSTISRTTSTAAAAVSHAIRQDPISVTLDGHAIFLLAFAIVLIIHFVETPFAEAAVALTPLVLLIWNDYQNFLNLGPGGTPSTFQGYVRISWLRLWALRDPFSPPYARPNDVPSKGHLLASALGGPLPYRPGPRPLVAGIAPQRQIDQHGCESVYNSLRKTLEKLAVAQPDRFGTAVSCFEKRGLALFALHPVNKTCQGEVCHVHHSDHSLHLTVHPEDSKEILEKGWGQRHPLAWKGWFGAMPVPEHFIMVYSPRDEHELRVVCRIIEASAWYVMGDAIKMEVSLRP